MLSGGIMRRRDDAKPLVLVLLLILILILLLILTMAERFRIPRALAGASESIEVKTHTDKNRAEALEKPQAPQLLTLNGK